ncbi:MAG TPA: BatD family protein [Saprospiraceae bacterium]|nr:BatD family protein [Saprospiraceae bacterium]
MAFKLIRGWLVALVLFMQTGLIVGQASFEAYTDARQVVKGNTFEVYFTLKNGNGKNFTPPSFSNFKIVSGPNQSVSTSIINGDVTKELTLSYILLTNKTGTFTIGPATVSVSGKTLKTAPVKIEVLEQSKTAGKSKADAEPIFLVAELSDSAAFIGQQVVLQYKIYTTRDIDSYNLLSESDYSGLYFEEIKRFDSRVQREVINGKQYSTKILKRIALFPQQTGQVEIAPMTLQLGVVAENQDPRRNMFFFRDVEMVTVSSNALTLKIERLPDGAPDNFSGGIGRYSMEISTKSTDITTDDVLEITMTVNGNGDPKRLALPPLRLPADFELYDPKITDESFFENSGEMVFRKVIQYFAAPRRAGSFGIEPSFCYFDTDSMQFVTLRADTLSLTVRKGSGIAASRHDEKTIAEKNIRTIKATTSLRRKGDYFINSEWFWALFSLPLLGFVFSFFYKKQSEKRGNLDASVLRSRQAEKVAARHLAEAGQLKEKGDSRGFYDEISRAVFGYICDKLQIPFSELTKSNVRQKLAGAAVPEHVISQIMEIIQTCEMALFAGKDNSEAMNEIFEAARKVIVEMEEQFKKS